MEIVVYDDISPQALCLSEINVKELDPFYYLLKSTKTFKQRLVNTHREFLFHNRLSIRGR